MKERYGLKDREVERTLQEWDEEQREFIKRFFDKDVTDPAHYDLLLNLDFFDWDKASELILEAYRRKFPSVNIAG